MLLIKGQDEGMAGVWKQKHKMLMLKNGPLDAREREEEEPKPTLNVRALVTGGEM